jgi:hypothetical protein
MGEVYGVLWDGNGGAEGAVEPAPGDRGLEAVDVLVEPGPPSWQARRGVGNDPALHGSEADELGCRRGASAADTAAFYAAVSSAWWASRPQYLEFGSAAFGQRRPLDMTAAQRPPVSSSS